MKPEEKLEGRSLEELAQKSFAHMTSITPSPIDSTIEVERRWMQSLHIARVHVKFTFELQYSPENLSCYFCP